MAKEVVKETIMVFDEEKYKELSDRIDAMQKKIINLENTVDFFKDCNKNTVIVEDRYYKYGLSYVVKYIWGNELKCCKLGLYKFGCLPVVVENTNRYAIIGIDNEYFKLDKINCIAVDITEEYTKIISKKDTLKNKREIPFDEIKKVFNDYGLEVFHKNEIIPDDYIVLTWRETDNKEE